MRGTVYGNAVKLKNIDVFDTQGAMNIKLEFLLPFQVSFF